MAGSKYEYRCVAGPTTIRVRRRKEREDAVRAFEEIINYQAADGWEYVGIDEFQTSEPQGCFGVSGQHITTLKMLVFKRVVSETELPEEKPMFRMPKPAVDTMPQMLADLEGGAHESQSQEKKSKGVFAFIGRKKKAENPQPPAQRPPSLRAPEPSSPVDENGRGEPTLSPPTPHHRRHNPDEDY